MFAHISVGVSDINKSIKLYDSLMNAIGHSRLFREEGEFMAYGPEDQFFIINTPLQPERGPVHANNGSHICFQATSPDQVDAFYQAAMEQGVEDGGTPGIRKHYADDYYAAFIYDFDGNKLEVMARKSL